MRYRAATTSLAATDAALRSVARTWNACSGKVDGWPAGRLSEPPVKKRVGPAWEDFPRGLRHEVEAYLAGLQKVHWGLRGKRIRPSRPSSIRTRRAELAAVAR